MLALVVADATKGFSKEEIKKKSRINEKEFRELVKKGYLESVKTRGIVRYRTTEAGREYCIRKANSLELIKYFRVKQVSDEAFLESLKSSYRSLLKTSPIAPYVKISDLRMKLTSELGISSEEFDRRIIELNNRNPYDIQLHVGSGEPSEGVKTARGVYHYVIIK
ncbi:MAG: hypothetical protein JTT15_04155 [Candidatus Brockarchaeota archaeon]|nr:hypothetical protein [Candidatus Brockarchaeota archaeon]